MLLLPRREEHGSGDRLAALVQNPSLVRATPALAFAFYHRYRIFQVDDAGTWRIDQTGYRYEVSERDGLELVAYHWHPGGRSQVIRPHLHARIRGSDTDHSKLHLPTGFVTPVEVVRFLITEFGVEPLRPDWEDVLAEG